MCYDQRHHKINTIGPLMTLIAFDNEEKRKAHPQAKLVNPYLMKNFFQNKLSNDEISILDDPKKLVGINLDIMPTEERARLYVCFMIASPSLNSTALIEEYGKTKFKLGVKAIKRVGESKTLPINY